ncbi:unnamed protein product [Durusdinium trenchii]|uniref:Ankyrin repeat-containing protein n=1 Tax=Durusdinium trenchii TaxID=1381693 RepID=A0ABP0N7U6_9DINO
MTEETDQPQAVELSQTSPSAPPAMVTESAAPIADEEAQELPTSSQVRESETSFQEHPEGPHQRPSGAMPGVFVIRHQKACKLILGSFLVVIIGFALHDQSSLLREIEEIGAWPETGWLHFSLSEWHWAAAAGHSAVVEQLLHSAADQETVDRNQEDLPALTSEANGRVVFRKGFAKNSWKLPSIHMALHFAALAGQQNLVEKLLQAGANKEAVGTDGHTALHVAAARGHENVVQQLLQAGANKEAVRKHGFTALHVAALEGHENVVQQLLQAGATEEAVGTNGHTALHLAAARGHENVVEKLLQAGANKEAVDTNDATALHVAAARGHENVVQQLRFNMEFRENRRIFLGFSDEKKCEEDYLESLLRLLPRVSTGQPQRIKAMKKTKEKNEPEVILSDHDPFVCRCCIHCIALLSLEHNLTSFQRFVDLTLPKLLFDLFYSEQIDKSSGEAVVLFFANILHSSKQIQAQIMKGADIVPRPGRKRPTEPLAVGGTDGWFVRLVR